MNEMWETKHYFTDFITYKNKLYFYAALMLLVSSQFC